MIILALEHWERAVAKNENKKRNKIIDEESASPQPHFGKDEMTDGSFGTDNSKSQSKTISSSPQPSLPRRGSLIVDGQTNMISYSYENDENANENVSEKNENENDRKVSPIVTDHNSLDNSSDKFGVQVKDGSSSVVNGFQWREPLLLLPQFVENPNKILKDKCAKLYYPKDENPVKYNGKIGLKFKDFKQDGWIYFPANVCLCVSMRFFVVCVFYLL